MKRKRGKKNILGRITAREIRGTFGRYFAIFAIIAIGVGFFAGLRITSPVLVRTVDRFYRGAQLYDYRLLSSLGWEEKEVEAFRAKKNVRAAEGAWQYDVIVENGKGANAVYKVHSMTEQINAVQLLEGRLPAAPDECLMDAKSRMGLAVGDRVRFSAENEEDTLDAFSTDVYTITGFSDASLYINFERGTTSIGNGTVAGYLYLPKSAFTAEYYTEIYVKLDSDSEIFSDEYTAAMDDMRTDWEDAAQAQAEIRYEDIRDEAEEELTDAKEEFAEKKADGERELSDAADELSDAEKELGDAKQELLDGKKELEDAAEDIREGYDELRDAYETLADGQKTLEENAEKLRSAREELEAARGQLTEGADALKQGYARLSETKETLDGARAQLLETKGQLDEAYAQISGTKTQLDEAQAELSARKGQLDEAAARLEETAAQLAAAQTQLRETEEALNAAETELSAQKGVLDAAQAELAAAKTQLDEAYAGLQAGRPVMGEEAYAAGMAAWEAESARYGESLAEYEEGLARYEAGYAVYKAGREQYEAGLAEYEAGRAQYEAGYAEYEAGRTQYEAGAAEYEAGRAQYEEGLTEYNTGVALYGEGLAEYESGCAQYEAGLAEYKTALAAYESGKEQYETGLAEYEAGAAQYAEGLADYEEGVAEYEDGKAELEQGEADYKEGLADYEEGLADYEEGLAEYEDGRREYEDGKADFDREIADAEEKIADAEKEIADIEEPDSWLLERNTNIAYACFESDSQIVRQVAGVFPIFFLLVAALVCTTTMTRMVEEMRGQIGTLKGLGYSRYSIMRGFLIYAGSAAAAGCVIGYAAGVVLFPTVIWYAYRTMYIDIPLRCFFDPLLFAGTMAASLLCSVGTAYLACRGALRESAASLMRPRAPKAGKRIFLEYIPALWSRLRFMHKVSMRNIFRYKKRLFMMILGIGGCMALLLTGFGLKDSIAGFAESQFDRIQVADAEVIFRRGQGDEVPATVAEALDALDASSIPLIRGSWDALLPGRVKSVDLVAPIREEGFTDFFRLLDDRGNEISLPAEGEALISMSLSKRYGIGAGEMLTLRNEDMKTMTVRVAGVFENHVYNYVFVAPSTLRAAAGEVDVNGLYVNFPEGEDVYSAQKKLAASADVSSVTILRDFRNRLVKMMAALDYVVLLVILSAAGLAFVVLYNLTNINIIERLREIATIKVLGFFRRETSDYILRENLVLTLMGAAAGIFLGKWLHRFVMSKIVVDLVWFPVKIAPSSYAYSLLLTFAFTALVNAVMSVRLEKINMAESLKSVE